MEREINWSASVPNARELSPLDDILASFQTALSTVFSLPAGTGRADPAEHLPEQQLSEVEKVQSSRLMRVNHVGEVCAQALYEGQALTAKNSAVKLAMRNAAAEEQDHLLWCNSRLHDLGGRASLLNPLWYAGSFVMGAVAGLAGDRRNLGFVKETEEQVEAHLNSHLDLIPGADLKSRAVVEQMKKDERAHADSAADAGAEDLPHPIPWAMRVVAKVMTRTAHWI
jgi:ubiquinone biosynthesis monooxygenase Coq7